MQLQSTKIRKVMGKDDHKSSWGRVEFKMPIRPPWLMLSGKLDIQLWILRGKSGLKV